MKPAPGPFSRVRRCATRPRRSSRQREQGQRRMCRLRSRAQPLKPELKSLWITPPSPPDPPWVPERKLRLFFYALRAPLSNRSAPTRVGTSSHRRSAPCQPGKEVLQVKKWGACASAPLRSSLRLNQPEGTESRSRCRTTLLPAAVCVVLGITMSASPGPSHRKSLSGSCCEVKRSVAGRAP